MKGVKGGLADLAEALYSGKDVSTTDATKALTKRKPPKKDKVTVTGSQGEWEETAVGILAAGDDLTFAVKGDDGWQVVAGWWPSLGLDQVHAGGKKFVLIIGSDARVKQGQKISRSRGDTLQIAAVDGKGNAGIVGVPRDSWSSAGKINSALAAGGPNGQTEAIADLTGLPVENWVITGFPGIKKFVDGLGGVTVNSPHPMPSRDIGKGKVHLDGEGAMWFARERKSLPGGDFDRSANQQRLLIAFALTMKSLGPSKFGKLVSLLDSVTRTNVSAEDALQYAAWAFSIKKSKMITAVATGGFGMRSGQSVVELGSEAHDLFDSFADGNLKS